MMKKTFIALIAITLFSVTTYASSTAGNFSVGLGPAGSIFLVDSQPDMDPGYGGYVFFDYRWSPQFSTQVSILVTTQDGTGRNDGDNGIEFLGMPTFDLKFFLFSEPSRWDPYGLIGIGIYAISEGSADNGTVAVGMGADIGLGVDYYISERFSVGLSAIFRAMGLIDSVGGDDNGRAQFPLSLLGNVAYHF